MPNYLDHRRKISSRAFPLIIEQTGHKCIKQQNGFIWIFHSCACRTNERTNEQSEENEYGKKYVQFVAPFRRPPIGESLCATLKRKENKLLIWGLFLFFCFLSRSCLPIWLFDCSRCGPAAANSSNGRCSSALALRRNVLLLSNTSAWPIRCWCFIAVNLTADGDYLLFIECLHV